MLGVLLGEWGLSLIFSVYQFICAVHHFRICQCRALINGSVERSTREDRLTTGSIVLLVSLGWPLSWLLSGEAVANPWRTHLHTSFTSSAKSEWRKETNVVSTLHCPMLIFGTIALPFHLTSLQVTVSGLQGLSEGCTSVECSLHCKCPLCRTSTLAVLNETHNRHQVVVLKLTKPDNNSS